MPLPFIIGGLAVATVATGVKKAFDGYQTKSAAEELNEASKKKYENARAIFEKKSSTVTAKLETLGHLQLKIGADFKTFQEIANELLEKIEQKKQKDLEINLPQHKLTKIADLSISATSVLGTLAGGVAGGAAAAYAAYGGVMLLGAASTGTPITALAGAAAYKATLAALGGGSLAAGGFGMAGGMMVLGAAAVAPVLLVAGFAFDMYADKALENAKEYKYEVDRATVKMQLSGEYLDKTASYVENLTTQLDRIYKEFLKYFEELKALNTLIRSGGLDIELVSDSIMTKIDNGYQIAAILTDIITTPLFKVKKDANGKVKMTRVDSTDVPDLELDKNGMQILNTEEMDSMIAKGTKEEIAKVLR